MLERMRDLFTAHGYAPHGYCLLWQPGLIALHVASDALIGLAYFSIPIAPASFLSRRTDMVRVADLAFRLHHGVRRDPFHVDLDAVARGLRR